MMSGAERERFAIRVMDEVRRWPGVELRQHASPTEPGKSDGMEFRLYGKQIGHVHGDCSVHLALTKALKASLIEQGLAESMPNASTSGWAMLSPLTEEDAQHAIWLLRLNYVRLRRQRLTPADAAKSELLQHHEAALGVVSTDVLRLLQRTQARAKPRPLPSLDEATTAPGSITNAQRFA
ncbi:MAG: luciferase family protein [Gemmatimonadaceae bacterium]